MVGRVVAVFVLLLGSAYALESGARRPLFSVRIPGSKEARLEIPSVAKLRELTQEIRRDLGSAGGARMVASRTIDAQRALLEVSAQTAADALNADLQNSNEAARFARRLFERLGATYVKLGQLVASSPTGVFPVEFVTEFEKCLDQAPPIPFEVVEALIEEAFQGKKLSELYSSFDRAPLATASIAQVHAAVLLDGRQVVVKVRKPNVEATLKCDLAFVNIAAKALEAVAPELGRVNLAAVLEDLRLSLIGEVDFTVEAERLVQFDAFLHANDLTTVCTCPLPVEELCRETVLTMTRLDGRPFVDLPVGPLSSEAAVATMIRVWALSVVEGPFFHADVHGANVFLCADGRVGFLDFGIVGTLEPSTYESIVKMAAAYQSRDYDSLAESLRGLGVAEKTMDMGAFSRDLKNIFSSQEDNNIAELIQEVISVSERNELRLPREFGLLMKQVLYLDRYIKSLAPDLDVFADPKIALMALRGAENNAATAPEQQQQQEEPLRQPAS